MTRIIAGNWGGRRLDAPKGLGTRPTTDRVREAVFSSLQSHFGDLDDLRVLDLFAGTGAFGLEALSRGAAFADFVEKDAKASGALVGNIKTLGAGASTRVHRTSAGQFVRSQADEAPAWDIVFIDPPYEISDDEVRDLVSLLQPHVHTDGIFVVERPKRSRFIWPEDIEPLREKRYGETQVWYGR